MATTENNNPSKAAKTGQLMEIYSKNKILQIGKCSLEYTTFFCNTYEKGNPELALNVLKSILTKEAFEKKFSHRTRGHFF